jgi:hypothetical protein
VIQLHLPVSQSTIFSWTLVLASTYHIFGLVFQHFSILRAAFIPLLGQLWQVTLYHLGLPFREVHVDGDLQESLQAICTQDTDNVVSTECPTAFILVRHAVQGYRLVLRLSHAQYDGTCLSAIPQTIANAYQRKPLDFHFDFSAYLAYTQQQRPNSIEFWRGILKDSQITKLPSSMKPCSPHDNVARLLKAELTICMPHLSGDITTAALISAV